MKRAHTDDTGSESAHKKMHRRISNPDDDFHVKKKTYDLVEEVARREELLQRLAEIGYNNMGTKFSSEKLSAWLSKVENDNQFTQVINVLEQSPYFVSVCRNALESGSMDLLKRISHSRTTMSVEGKACKINDFLLSNLYLCKNSKNREEIMELLLDKGAKIQGKGLELLQRELGSGNLECTEFIVDIMHHNRPSVGSSLEIISQKDMKDLCIDGAFGHALAYAKCKCWQEIEEFNNDNLVETAKHKGCFNTLELTSESTRTLYEPLQRLYSELVDVLSEESIQDTSERYTNKLFSSIEHVYQHSDEAGKEMITDVFKSVFTKDDIKEFKENGTLNPNHRIDSMLHHMYQELQISM